jgi:hypothetical protein
VAALLQRRLLRVAGKQLCRNAHSTLRAQRVSCREPIVFGRGVGKSKEAMGATAPFHPPKTLTAVKPTFKHWRAMARLR